MCPDLEHIQRSALGFQADMIPRSIKYKDSKILTMDVMKGHEHHEQIIVHKLWKSAQIRSRLRSPGNWSVEIIG